MPSTSQWSHWGAWFGFGRWKGLLRKTSLQGDEVSTMHRAQNNGWIWLDMVGWCKSLKIFEGLMRFDDSICFEQSRMAQYPLLRCGAEPTTISSSVGPSDASCNQPMTTGDTDICHRRRSNYKWTNFLRNEFLNRLKSAETKKCVFAMLFFPADSAAAACPSSLPDPIEARDV